MKRRREENLRERGSGDAKGMWDKGSRFWKERMLRLIIYDIKWLLVRDLKFL